MFSRPMIGRKIEPWRLAKAISVPIEMPPEIAGKPATRYSTAGIAAKTMPMVAIRQRPASCERTSRSISLADVSVNRAWPAGPLPSVFVSSAPLMLRVSSTWVCRSERAFCLVIVRSRRTSATRRVSRMAGGSTSSDSRESRQFRATIATAVATAVVRLEAIEVAVVVITDCRPATSCISRDWMSPPRVRLKKAIDWAWR